MQEFLQGHYMWLRAFHVISMTAWMAGMFYLPRLFAYHVDAEKDSKQSETFKIMEKRLMRIIMGPASIATWLFGGLLIWANPYVLEMPWMHMKLTCVVLMTALHHVFMIWRKKFERDENIHTAKFYKIWNEIPTVLFVVIVIMVLVKPFEG